MSNEASLDAMLGIKPGSRPSDTLRRVSRIDRRGRRWPAMTGAVTRGNLLAIATVEIVGTELRLRSSASGFHELDGREQSETRAFSRNLTNHISSARARHLILRVSPENGPYTAKGAVYRAEAILHLVPGLTVETVHTQKVGSWCRGASIALPEPDVAGAKYVAVQRSAIEAAAFGLLLGREA